MWNSNRIIETTINLGRLNNNKNRQIFSAPTRRISSRQADQVNAQVLTMTLKLCPGVHGGFGGVCAQRTQFGRRAREIERKRVDCQRCIPQPCAVVHCADVRCAHKKADAEKGTRKIDRKNFYRNDHCTHVNCHRLTARTSLSLTYSVWCAAIDLSRREYRRAHQMPFIYHVDVAAAVVVVVTGEADRVRTRIAPASALPFEASMMRRTSVTCT